VAGVEEATKLSNPDVRELLQFLQTKMTPSEVVLNGLFAITQLIDVLRSRRKGKEGPPPITDTSCWWKNQS